MPNILPSLDHIKLSHGWELICPAVYANHLSAVEDFLDSRLSHLEKAETRFLLEEPPLLLSVKSTEKKMYLSSQHCAYEMFLLDVYQTFPRTSCRERWEKLKCFVDDISRLEPNWTSWDELTALHGLPDLVNEEFYQALEDKAVKYQQKLKTDMKKYTPSWFEKASDWGLQLTAGYALFRIHLLKFLAILPSLNHDLQGVEVRRLFLETLRRLKNDSRLAQKKRKTGQEAPIPKTTFIAVKLLYTLCGLLPAKFVAFLIRFVVKQMARRFIAGETIEEAKTSLQQLHQSQRCATLDQLGELVVSAQEADHYQSEVLKLIKGWKLHVAPGERNSAGILKAHVSLKVTALCADFNPTAFDYTYQQVAPRLREILLEAQKEQVFINIDAEHDAYRECVLSIYDKLLSETEPLKNFADTGIVIQAYLQDAYLHFQKVLSLARKRKLLMPVRLVKGAYWDAETVEAQAHDFPAPQFLNKEETDLHFRQLAECILKEQESLQLCLGSHNWQDHSWVEALREERYPQAPAIEHQCLHMTYEALSHALAAQNWAVRNYIPIGSLLVGMAYLVRRIMENSSQVGILSISRSHQSEQKVQPPQVSFVEKKKRGELVLDGSLFALGAEFKNVQPVRLYHEPLCKKLKTLIQEFVAFHPLLELNGKKHSLFSPSQPEQEVGSLCYANIDDARHALEQLAEGCQTWSHDVFLRLTVLQKAAQLMLLKRFELATLIVHEAGKTATEALADVDEAIDFLNFYCREELRLQKTRARTSLGTVVVIAPWNFPLAIPCGMVVGALVAGNTVILKSSEKTPLVAAALTELFYQAGLPQNVLKHLPGEGHDLGQFLLDDARPQGYIFTGSKKIGLHLYISLKSRLRPDFFHDEKRIPLVITEMGGKNAFIITANAELDETVAGVLYSAYGHAGQKCSAASRIFVEAGLKENFIRRFVQASKDLSIGAATDLATFMNPVVNQHEKERLQQQAQAAIAEAKQYGGRVLLDRSQEDFPGHCVGPVIIELPAERCQYKDSWAQQELFGPVVHVVGYKDLKQAIQLFNGVEYALTGGIYAQSQDDIDLLLSRLQAGNLYVNRPNTGARVTIEPFGGFKLSGTGPKAGGDSYIEQFHRDALPQGIDEHEPEWGSQTVSLGQNFPLHIKERRRRFKYLMTELRSHYTKLFQKQGADGHKLTKKQLEEFRAWVKQNLIAFSQHRHWNQKIPGQLSYDSYEMLKESALLITTQEMPLPQTLFSVLAALVVGCPLTVVCKTNKAMCFWTDVKKLCKKASLSFSLCHPSEQAWQEFLEQSHVSVVILEEDSQQIEADLHQFFQKASRFRAMTTFLTLADLPSVGEWSKFLELFVQKRSFAVNTMRHGAPLETSLDRGR